MKLSNERSLRRGWTLAPILPLFVLFAACDSDSEPTGPDDGHDDAGRVEVSTRGPVSSLLAVWHDGEGWEDASGNPITELPDPVDVAGGNGLQPLRAGQNPASLSVVFYEQDGTVVEMGTLSQDDETGARECTVSNVRYYPLDNETNIVAWPNMQHPDNATGPFQFAERGTGEVVAIYHCDHVSVYPEEAGSVEIEFHLWHADHSDMETDPISVEVLPAVD